MTITEFLLARIAEDEARYGLRVGDVQWQECSGPSGGGQQFGFVSPSSDYNPRMLAECEAKRRIVELHQSWPVLVETPPNLEVVASDDPSTIAVRTSKRLAWLTEQEYRARFGDEPPTAPMLRALASVYADHPDFDLAWRAE